MQHTYSIKGMTCNGCASSVQEQLSKVEDVQDVQVDLENAEATITMSRHVSMQKLEAALSDKYAIGIKEENHTTMDAPMEKSKWEQLRPLFLIFAYLFAAAILLNYQNWSFNNAMLDFMGLFYIVFSFFKFLDLKGFPESFRMYDPLAKAVPFYGKMYPFLELALGLLFLMRVQIPLALILTIVILGITTYGVTKSLLDKKSIRCACLGTALNLPMTEATFIENAIMLVMAVSMLLQF